MINDLRNRFDYFLRCSTKFSRKNYKGEIDNAESRYVFDILNQHLKPFKEERLSILDIGSKNWAYVKGEYDFWKQYCNEIKLDGVEIDAYRLYYNFYSRYEVAKFYTKDLEGVSYYADNLLNINNEYDYIVWLLPFVTIYPLEKWGLPKKYFMPETLLKHAYDILKKQMLIVNQGEEEAQIQQKMLDKLRIKYEFLGEIKSKEIEYKNKRFGFLVNK